MIQKNEINWNDEYEYDGLLYFAQRIVEMLDYLTIDIYRAPLMNTPRLVDEYLNAIKNNVRDYHLEQILDEFKDSFRNDIIIQKMFGQEWIDQRIDKLNKDKTNRQAIMHYLKNTMDSFYLDWTIEYIKEAVKITRNNRKIERAIRCFIPELLRNNYSREEVSLLIKRVIIDTSSPENALEEFIGNYNGEKKEYKIYLGISKKLDRFKDVLERRIGISFEDDGFFDQLSVKPEFMIGVMNSEAYDAKQAAKNAYNHLKLFVSFYKFYGNYSLNLICEKAIVIIDSDDPKCIYLDTSKFKSFVNRDFDEIGKFTEISVTRLIFGNKKEAFSEIKKIVKLHSSAISNNGLENGLINLWSILEILCVREKRSKDITQIIEAVLPIMQRNYLKSVFIDITSNVKKVLDADKYLELLSLMPPDNDIQNIAYIILLSEHIDKYDELLEQLINYPVLRSKIEELHSNNTTKKLYGISEKYAKRISWHIYRIYRARNDIAHHGKTPDDLKDLGEHLHTYVDTVSTEVIIRLANSDYKSFSDVLIQSAFLHDKIKGIFNKQSEQINEEMITIIFDPYSFL